MNSPSVLELLLEARGEELANFRTDLASQPRGDRDLVSRIEAEVAASPTATISVETGGRATITAAGHRLSGGHFAPMSIGQLRTNSKEAASGGDKRALRFSVICGNDAATDVGLLQATARQDTLFQVASQFNCLEAPGPGVVPVADYFGDGTQGPRAAISAFPGALVRHYAVPTEDGGRFQQTDTRQLNLLASALPEPLARVRAGYLMTPEIPNLDRAANSLEARFDEIRVGVHDAIPVLLGDDWDGPVKHGQRVAQVFTSTVALGGYSGSARMSDAVELLCRCLLRAAYLGTLLAAATLHKRRVVLTMVGGGAFGNPHELIWDSILWALQATDELRVAPLDVVLNGRDINQSLAVDALREAVDARGGVVVEAKDGRVQRLS